MDGVNRLEASAIADGGMTVVVGEGQTRPGVLVSDANYVIAVREFDELPFKLTDIDDVLQSALDKIPRERGGRRYWDDWKV